MNQTDKDKFSDYPYKVYQHWELCPTISFMGILDVATEAHMLKISPEIAPNSIAAVTLFGNGVVQVDNENSGDPYSTYFYVPVSMVGNEETIRAGARTALNTSFAAAVTYFTNLA